MLPLTMLFLSNLMCQPVHLTFKTLHPQRLVPCPCHPSPCSFCPFGCACQYISPLLYIALFVCDDGSASTFDHEQHTQWIRTCDLPISLHEMLIMSIMMWQPVHFTITIHCFICLWWCASQYIWPWTTHSMDKDLWPTHITQHNAHSVHYDVTASTFHHHYTFLSMFVTMCQPVHLTMNNTLNAIDST